MRHRRNILLKAFALLTLTGLVLLLTAFLYVHLNRHKIAELLKTKLEQTFHGKTQVQRVRFSVFDDFPNFSLTMVNTLVLDSLQEQPLVDFEKIHLRIRIFDLIRKRINVRGITFENGTIFLFKDSSGYSNTGMFQSFNLNQQGSNRLSFFVKQFSCHNIRFVYREEKLGKNISMQLGHIKGKLQQQGNELEMSLSGTLHVDSLMFRHTKGSYLRDKDLTISADMRYNRKSGELDFQPVAVTMDKQQYALSGCFILRQPLFMNLYIDNPSCTFDIAKSALTPKIQQSLSSFSIPAPIELRVSITGESQPFLPPMVDVFAQLRDRSMKAYKVDFTDMNMSALFTNHLAKGKVNDKSNSGIFITVRSGRMVYIPFNASIAIMDLDSLYCRADWKTRMDLTDFNMLDVFRNFYFNKGTADFQLSYSGNLSNYKDSIAIGFNDTLNGMLTVNDAVLEYPQRQLQGKEINAEVFFTEEEFNFQCVQAKLNGNDIHLTGTMSGIRRLLTDEVSKMKGTFELYSPLFDISKVLLGKKNMPSPVRQQKESHLTLLPTIISRITNDITFDVDVRANTIRFQKLTAQHFSGNLRLSSDVLALNDFSMNTCNGNLLASAKLITRGAQDKFQIDAQVKDVDITTFFRATNNFNQDAITHENLSGQLSAQVQLNAPLDNTYTPIADSIRAKIFFSLRNGELTNYQPVMEIDNFIFRKRDMQNIRFAEIRDTFLLNGREMTIMRMEVASSVMRLFVKGKYTFKGPAEIFVQVPLKNLRKPDADAAARNLELDGKAGASIFLKVHGTAGNLKVSLSPAGRKEMKSE